MAAIDFPNSPTTGDTFTVGDITWEWTGTVWQGLGTAVPGPAGEPGVVAATAPVTYDAGTRTVGVTQDFANQTTRTFADAAARSAAIPTPTEGMVTYLADTDTFEGWTGAAWTGIGGGGGGREWTLLNPGGTAIALTGAATITLSDIGGYDNYAVIIQSAACASNSNLVSLRVNGSSTNYRVVGMRIIASITNNTTYILQAENLTDRILLSKSPSNGTGGGNSASGFATISGASTSGAKQIQAQGASFADYTANHEGYVTGGFWSDSAVITSISALASAGNFSGGSMFIYGA